MNQKQQALHSAPVGRLLLQYALVPTAVVLHTIHSYRKKGGISHE